MLILTIFIQSRAKIALVLAQISYIYIYKYIILYRIYFVLYIMPVDTTVWTLGGSAIYRTYDDICMYN